MLISWKHNFIFVHIPKTAGTSLTQALAPYARNEDRAIYMIRRAPAARRFITALLGGDRFIEQVTGFKAHARLSHFVKRYGHEKAEAMTKIIFVRNPFSRAYSLYGHIARDRRHPQHQRFSEIGFDGALDAMIADKWPTQSTFGKMGPKEDLSVDFIGRFETIDADSAALFSKLGRPAPKKLPRVNIGGDDAPDYAALFRGRLDDFVARFREDFENFGYSTDPSRALETPATLPHVSDSETR